MSTKCELINRCGFFQNFKGNANVLKEGWVRAFCDDTVKSEKCVRKQTRIKTGKPPVDNMAPTGRLL